MKEVLTDRCLHSPESRYKSLLLSSNMLGFETKCIVSAVLTLDFFTSATCPSTSPDLFRNRTLEFSRLKFSLWRKRWTRARCCASGKSWRHTTPSANALDMTSNNSANCSGSRTPLFTTETVSLWTVICCRQILQIAYRMITVLK